MKRPAATRLTALGALWRGLALALLLCTAAVAGADGLALEDGGRFEVRSAFLEPAEHVYQLNATIDLALSRNTQQAIRDGVPVAIDFCNPAPDAEAASVGQANFEWVVEAVAEMAIRKAREHVPGRDNLSWGKYVQAGVTRSAL